MGLHRTENTTTVGRKSHFLHLVILHLFTQA